MPTIPSPIEPTTSTPTSTSTPSPKDTTPPAVPLLDTLFSQIIYTTSSAYDIYGSCATDTLKILSSTSSLPFAPSSTFWNFNAPLFPGHNYFSFAAVDVDFNTSTFSDSAHIVLDNEPPLAPIIATEELMATSGLKISLSGADDLSPTVYDLFYQVYSTSTAAEGDGDSASSSVWTTIVTSTPETSVDFSATRGESYLFRARATDILGHVSPWSDEASASVPVRLDWSKQVVINEIGWAGTRDDDSGRADEWVELYNNTDEDIDLTNWKLIVTDRPIVFSASTTIRAHSYFLMERTDDLTVKNIPADYIFTLSGNMKNSGEKLQLVDGAGEIIDEVDCEKGWYAGQSDSEPFLSMARVDPKGSGNNPDNWLDASGPWKDALTYDGYRLIYGSPRESNSRKLTVLSGTQIDSELNLSRENGPYFLDNYTLPAGATLRMDAGTEINLPAHGGFVVNGILEINGSAEDPVVFQPVPSSTVWGNIIFTGADVNIQYANFSRGNYETIIKNHGALFFVSSTAVLDHVLMWNNRDPGISINAKNSNLTVKNSSIGYDEKHDIAAMPGSNTTGINIREGGELNLENVLFTNLTLGVSGGSMHDPDFPKLKINLMPPDNFVNVDYPWQPTNWLELISPTSTPE